MNQIDKKINRLLEVSTDIPYIDYYTHTSMYMYKINNPYTPYAKDIVVLCSIDEGFEKALDIAYQRLKAYMYDYSFHEQNFDL